MSKIDLKYIRNFGICLLIGAFGYTYATNFNVINNYIISTNSPEIQSEFDINFRFIPQDNEDVENNFKRTFSYLSAFHPEFLEELSTDNLFSINYFPLGKTKHSNYGDLRYITGTDAYMLNLNQNKSNSGSVFISDNLLSILFHEISHLHHLELKDKKAFEKPLENLISQREDVIPQNILDRYPKSQVFREFIATFNSYILNNINEPTLDKLWNEKGNSGESTDFSKVNIEQLLNIDLGINESSYDLLGKSRYLDSIMGKSSSITDKDLFLVTANHFCKYGFLPDYIECNPNLPSIEDYLLTSNLKEL